MIRLGTIDDLDRILEIYDIARETMRNNGNYTQWGVNYPNKEITIKDIKDNNLYVIVFDNIIHGVFTFIIGEEDTYQNIYQGNWLSNSVYGTIHRLASDNEVKGIFTMCINYCKERIPHIRIDTHKNNKIMNHLILKNGFQKCGIIYVEDGTERIAYEYIE